MSSVCEMMFYLCLRMRNGNHSTRCWKLVSLEARVSRATAQGCVFNYRVPRNPSLGCHKQPFFWAWEPDLDCFLRGRAPESMLSLGASGGFLWPDLGYLETGRLLSVPGHGPQWPCLYQLVKCLVPLLSPVPMWPDSSGPAALNGPQPTQESVAGPKGSCESGQSLLQAQEKSCYWWRLAFQILEPALPAKVSFLPFGDHCFLALKCLIIGDNVDSNFHEKEEKKKLPLE